MNTIRSVIAVRYRVTTKDRTVYVYATPEEAINYQDRIKALGIDTQWEVVNSNPQGVYTRLTDLIELLNTSK